MDNPFEQLHERLASIESMLLNLQNGSNNLTAPSTSKEKPISIKELCEHLNITEPTALRWRKKGKIPFFTIGAAVRFNLSEVLIALAGKN